MKVEYSPKALDDIDRARQYVFSELFNPQAASEIVSDIFDTGDRLGDHPELGARFRSVLPVLSEYRHITAGNYVLIYRIQSATVKIIRVLHRLQDSAAILVREES